jgi:cytoskeleton protein RodZ
VFEIGNSLREARLRQGLDLARVEDDTKIRAKYLQALEDERFDVLPAETYVKGFLRTYAEYLGLDGQLYVDEFNSRFAASEEPLAASAPPTRRSRGRPGESSFVVVALAGIVAVAVLFVVAFAFRDGDTAEPRGEAAGQAATPPASASMTLEVRAAREPCRITVRAGSATGRTLIAGTMRRGERQRWIGRRFSLHFPGRPCASLQLTVDGRRVPLPAGATTVSVTSRGVTELG